VLGVLRGKEGGYEVLVGEASEAQGYQLLAQADDDDDDDNDDEEEEKDSGPVLRIRELALSLPRVILPSVHPQWYIISPHTLRRPLLYICTPTQ
jgi:hypothetical protein